MMQITQTYPNAVSRVLTVSAVAATDDADTVLATTVEDGEVLVCRHDNAGLWQQLCDLGLVFV